MQSGVQAAQSILEDVSIIDTVTHLPTPVRRIYLDPPTWPLQDPEEATLLQHFINQVSLFVSEPGRCLVEVLNNLPLPSSTSVTRSATSQPSCPSASAHAALY